ncbi:MAG: POTRA domain-containing protein, partial [Spirochaetota bacterium]|nr:POTRA domain-containing protein [Spirochaetota bacterium]
MKRTVIAILFIFLAILVFSLEEDKVIGNISISGLKRTNESVIYNILKVKEGDNFSLFNEEVFTQD